MTTHAVKVVGLSITLVTAIGLSFAGCAPAGWTEKNGGANGASGAPSGGGSGGGPVSSPKAATEQFVQDSAANKVDILIINDNSASMDEEQRKMSTRFTSFVSDLKGLDYRIGMTTTDIETPKYGLMGKIVAWSGTTAKVLTPRTADADKKFKQTIVRSETIDCQSRNDCPSKNEQPLRALELAMDQHAAANKDLFRDGVDLAVVVLSDEDELSTGPANATTPQHVIQHFKNVFGDTKRLQVHGLVVMLGDSKCLDMQAHQGPVGSKTAYATHVTELASLTGGTVHSICDADYSKDLAAISSQVRKLASSFELREAPISSSVSVVLTPTFKTKWSIDGKNIIFDPAPPAGTKIDVNYTY